jgi:hypothetical protein
MTPDDKDKFSKLPPNDQVGTLVYLEARGEPVGGQIAVGCAVRNRVKVNKNNTYFSIITAENQFSCLNSNSPEHGLAVEIIQNLLSGKQPEDLTGVFQQCRWIGQGIVSSILLDETKGATFYYNPKLCNPSWAKTMIVTIAIGNHIFLKGN